jgi:hypothetical protein
MLPRGRDPRRSPEATDDFYRRPRRGNPAVAVEQPTTFETGAQVARPRRDSYRPPGRDNRDIPSGFVGRGRRGGPTALNQRSNAVRPRAYAEKPWLLTTTHNDENDNDEDENDDDDDDEDPHAFLARLLAEPRPQLMPARPPTSFDMIPTLRKVREETKRKGGERHGWAIMASQERLRTPSGGDHVAKDAEGVTAPAQQPVAVKTGAQVDKPLLDATAAADEDNAGDNAGEIQRQTLLAPARETIAGSEHATKAGMENKLQKVSTRALAHDETSETRLPNQLWHSMSQKKPWLYDPKMASWHADQRVADKPRQEKFELSYGRKAHEANNVTLTFRHNDGNVACSIGLIPKPGEGAPNRRYVVDLHWITHSQFPGLRFTIRRGLGIPNARVWFHANTLGLSAEQNNGRRHFLMSHKLVDHMEDGSKAARTGTIWETRFSLWSEEAVAAGAIQGVPLTPARPQVSDISQADLDRIIATGARAKTKGDPAILSPGDWAIWGLMTTNDIQVSRSWNGNKEGMTVYNFFVQYMDMHLKNVLEFGFWPHYVRQARKAGKDLYAPDYDVSELEVPRIIVKSWRVRWQKNVPVMAEAETWLAFPFLVVYPNEKTEAFGRRIGAERGRGRNHLTLEDRPKKATSMAQNPKEQPDNDEGDYDTSLSDISRRKPPPVERVHRPSSFDKIPAALRKASEESNRNAREQYRTSVEINQKCRRSMSQGEPSAQDAEGDTTMAAGKPATESLAEDQPAAKKQKIVEPPVPCHTIVHELPTAQRSYQQGPSLEEENALFVDEEQAVGEKPKVIVRLPW